MTESPFITHRGKVLGCYSTAKWLRGVVMSLYNGQGHPVGLSQLSNCDSAHFAAFQEMIGHYRRIGESDPALHSLAHEIEKLQEQEAAAELRSQRLEEWNDEARDLLRGFGRSADVVDDRFNWFEVRFDSGRTPTEAVAEFSSLK